MDNEVEGLYGPRVLALVLAGGKGTRLWPLTRYRAKPAVPIFGKYRIIDFVLSNLVNSGVFSIYVLTQYRAQSLADHIEQGWQLGPALRSRDFFVSLAPAQMWTGEHWYQGTADAVYQNLHLVATFDADEILIFSADHVYKMDVGQMMEWHRLMGAEVTVAVMPVPRQEAHRFGVVQVDEDGWIRRFVEKPRENPPTMPGDPSRCLVSMGNYIFRRETLEAALLEDARRPDSSHDFGQDILPRLVASGTRVAAYNFETNRIPGEPRPYWRDVGTLFAYWEAHMETLHPERGGLNLYNPRWPIRTVSFRDPPALVTSAGGVKPTFEESLVAEGARVYGAEVIRSVIGRGVVVEPGAHIEESILFYGVRVQKGARLRRVIVDKRRVIEAGTAIGYDPEQDRARGYHVTREGIVVVPAGPPKLRLNQPWPEDEGRP